MESSRDDALKRLAPRQRARINVFRALGVVVVPPVLFIRPYFDGGALGAILEETGIMLIIACVLGRCWAMLYIGGNKNGRLVTTGPYSLCRNPLYTFSVMGAAGCGLMTQSLICTVFLTLAAFAILLQAVRKEEGFLSAKFGEDYGEYRNRTPRFLPVGFRKFRTQPVLNVDVPALRRCFWDAAFFMVTIPALERVERLQETGAVATFMLF